MREGGGTGRVERGYVVCLVGGGGGGICVCVQYVCVFVQ